MSPAEFGAKKVQPELRKISCDASSPSIHPRSPEQIPSRLYQTPKLPFSTFAFAIADTLSLCSKKCISRGAQKPSIHSVLVVVPFSAFQSTFVWFEVHMSEIRSARLSRGAIFGAQENHRELGTIEFQRGLKINSRGKGSVVANRADIGRKAETNPSSSSSHNGPDLQE